MKRENIVFLPGFLGVENDFSFLGLEGHFYPLVPEISVDHWAEKFISFASSMPTPRALVAYSMGGRLALSALSKKPDLFDQVILMSAHLGISDLESRKLRLENDLRWASDFETMPWNLLMKKWNGQEALASFEVKRQEAHYDRKVLGGLLRSYSLGKQPDYSKEKFLIHHLIGEKDPKLRQFDRTFEVHLIPNASHRLLWENPAFVKKTILHILAPSG